MFVMAGLVPAIHVFKLAKVVFVDARHKAGHDGGRAVQFDVGDLRARSVAFAATELVLTLALTLALVGCTQEIKMYPVQGPMAQQKPLPIMTGTADGITSNTGNLTVVYSNGEKCSGKWSSAAPQMTSVTSVSLIGQYGAVAGLATTAGSVPGVNRGEAFIVCPSGVTLQAEFFTGSGTANGYGVAKDSAGNVFKLLF